MEIFSLLLRRYLVPEREVQRLLGELKAGGYRRLRDSGSTSENICALQEELPDMDVCSVKVSKNSLVTGKTLRETALRQDYGVTLVAVRREGATFINPDPDFCIIAEDIVTLIGREKVFNKVWDLFE